MTQIGGTQLYPTNRNLELTESFCAPNPEHSRCVSSGGWPAGQMLSLVPGGESLPAAGPQVLGVREGGLIPTCSAGLSPGLACVSDMRFFSGKDFQVLQLYRTPE